MEQFAVHSPTVRSLFYFCAVFVGTIIVSEHGPFYVAFNSAFAPLVFRGIEGLLTRWSPSNVPYVPLYFGLFAICRLALWVLLLEWHHSCANNNASLQQCPGQNISQ